MLNAKKFLTWLWPLCLVSSFVIGMAGSPVYGAPSLPEGFVLEAYVSDDALSRPVDLEWAPNGWLFVGTKKGIVWIVENDVLIDTPFINIEAEVNSSSDRGMLGTAVHPDFPNTPWVYLLYTYDPPETVGQIDNLGPDGTGQRVARMIRVSADPATNYKTALPGSEVILLGTTSVWENIGDPAAGQDDLSTPWTCGPTGAYIRDCIAADGRSHSLGTVTFGADGMLYISSGDASSWSTADPRALRSLHIDSPIGKILRIDPITGGGLPDNPFWDGDPDSNRSKVWQLGFKNPYRIQISPYTGEVYSGDVGRNGWEELNYGPPGTDFGWPCYEGGNAVLIEQPIYSSLAECQEYYTSNNAVAAPYAYPHVSGIGGSIIPGGFYTHTKWPAEYHGKMFFADYATQEMSYAQIDGNSVTVTPFATELLSVDMAVGPDGDLYTVNVQTNVVERIVYQGGSTGNQNLDIRVATGSDDAEETADGTMRLTSSDLELVFDGSDQIIGLRFNNIAVEAGAQIEEAFIQFTVDEVSSVETSLLIEGEANDDALTFDLAAGNISSRPVTFANVAWAPAAWTTVGAAGSNQRTPDISPIISEIVNRAGWESGNSLVILFSGSGERVAESYNGSATAAPLLHIGVSKTGGNSPPSVIISAPSSGTTVSGGTPITFTGTASDLEDGDLTSALSWISSLDGPLPDNEGSVTAVLSNGTHTITARVTDNDGATGSASITVNVTSVGTPPTATISSPTGSELWVINSTVNISGTGSDPEDGELTGSALVWEGKLHHNEHVHFDFYSATGQTGSFVYYDHGDNTYIELCLTATDSDGLSDKDCVDLLANLLTYTFSSVPSGLNLTYDGGTSVAPFNVLVPEGGSRQISVPDPQGSYSFDSWSIGGPATQLITIGPTDETITANFTGSVNSVPSVTIAMPSDGSSVIAGTEILFTGSASDSEDGDLTNILSWTSSLDGPMGIGGSTTEVLSLGAHTISASAIDSGGLSGAASITVIVTPPEGDSEIIEVQVTSSSDDAEERATGSMKLSSTDLELVYDGGGDQAVGMRFNGVGIPQGATITNAYIQFEADEANTVGTTLVLQGEVSDNAATFTSTRGNISSRPRTAATVTWSPVSWDVAGESGTGQRTPNIAAVVQEIVNQPGWSNGNSMAIIATGAGERVAVAYDGTPAGAPLLHVEFSFTTIDVPPVAKDDSASTPENTAVNIDVAANDFDANGNLDPATVNTACPTCSEPSNGALLNNGDGSFTYTPVLDFNGANSFVYQICDSLGACDTATVNIDVTAAGGVLDIRITAGADDAEERATGGMQLSSTDLELVYDGGGDQLVGLRFNAVNIPQNAVITSAYIQFQADETSTVETSLLIHGENTDNAAAFTSTRGNISSRVKTVMAVPWSPAPWTNVGEAGPDQMTPSIAGVIQEVVDRGSWSSGNSLVIIITGTGERIAEAYEGSADGAPLLHVEYGLP
ncbi:PQQ-dependent sugar dehydrogenase [Photobacterium sp.]|uniref:PQQ-dependent sugar dehydrogenase n=1 Tax=Photobacterium sp. TaxID=660 RepID=UPI00299D97B6|nr:PQQ-dependent sugar dehydrogenase [Photobacterium sp.]MDX1303600.1 PQQ-dependent sugar dehydrogenase [Photobacterium sp.]